MWAQLFFWTHKQDLMAWVLIMDTYLIAACLTKDLEFQGLEQPKDSGLVLQIYQVDMELTIEWDNQDHDVL